MTQIGRLELARFSILQTLLRALAGDQHDAFSMFSSSIPRFQDQRGHHTSESRRLYTAHHASRPGHHRAHGSINHDHSSLQSGQSIRERPQVEHLLSMRNTDDSTSRPTPQDQQNWRRFDGRNSSGTGSLVGMIVDLEQRREENIAARSLRSFTSTGIHGLENGFVLQVRRIMLVH